MSSDFSMGQEMSGNFHILMLLSNGYKPDPRVQREAQGLVERGYRVTVLCWDRQGERAQEEVDQGVEIVRVHSVRTRYGQGWRQMRNFPRFWRECVRFARSVEPDAIHCHDLDTLYAGWRIKRWLGCPLVYDAHENYPAMMTLYLPGLVVGGLNRLEHWLLGKVDSTITASTVLRDELKAAGVAPVITLGNYPPIEPFASADLEQVTAERERLRGGGTAPSVGYVGGFTRNRLLEPFLEAARKRSETEFHLWGDGHQRNLVESVAAERANVTYHGWLDHSELPLTFKALDIIYYGLRQDYPGAIYNAPNTLAQAMAAGRPVIATNVGDLGRIVTETDCGLLLRKGTSKAIAEAIDELGDATIRERLGSNGLRAASAKYNAAAMQDRLAAVYEQLRL